MRMWMVNVRTMCRKHLLGEHVECHMIAGSINKGRRLDGFVDSNALQLKSLITRHDAIAREMIRRKYKHKSPLAMPIYNSSLSTKVISSRVNRVKAMEYLHARCEACRIMGAI